MSSILLESEQERLKSGSITPASDHLIPQYSVSSMACCTQRTISESISGVVERMERSSRPHRLAEARVARMRVAEACMVLASLAITACSASSGMRACSRCDLAASEEEACMMTETARMRISGGRSSIAHASFIASSSCVSWHRITLTSSMPDTQFWRTRHACTWTLAEWSSERRCVRALSMPLCLIIASTLFVLRKPSLLMAPHTLACASGELPSSCFRMQSQSPGKLPSVVRLTLAPSDVHRHPRRDSGAEPLGSEDDTRYSTAAAAALASGESSWSTTARRISSEAPAWSTCTMRSFEAALAVNQAALGSMVPGLSCVDKRFLEGGCMCAMSSISSALACSSKNLRRSPISGALIVRPNPDVSLSAESIVGVRSASSFACGSSGCRFTNESRRRNFWDARCSCEVSSMLDRGRRIACHVSVCMDPQEYRRTNLVAVVTLAAASSKLGVSHPLEDKPHGVVDP
mmetsp:Transcript_15534/g.31114  ORF Transcript_15534/g.31114 Transcript_15534/m.31114 type:complete len:464 (+) Transcript_15534:1617-3008(+)